MPRCEVIGRYTYRVVAVWVCLATSSTIQSTIQFTEIAQFTGYS